MLCRAEQSYGGEPVSGFQKAIRGSETVLKDHICKTMNALNMRRCTLIPKNMPGADWRALVLHVREYPEDETYLVSFRWTVLHKFVHVSNIDAADSGMR
jgi:DNA (cytosine-5)-methyltransferase 1